MQIFIHKSGQQQGPYSIQELNNLAQTEPITENDMCWFDGCAGWMPLSECPGFIAFSSSPHPQSISPASPRTAPFLGGLAISIKCENCGAQLDYSSGSDVAACSFCGSKFIIRQQSHDIERLRDLENGILSVTYSNPLIAVSDAPSFIVRAISQETVGFRKPQGLAMRSEGVFFPTWYVTISVQCSWQGRYSERRTVIKVRSVTKTDANGRSYTVQEQYNDTEVFWIPTSGTHQFGELLHLPAVPGFSLAQLAKVISGNEAFGSNHGTPVSTPDFAVARPTLSQSQSWTQFEYDALVDRLARGRCAQCVEILENVSAVTDVRRVALVYLPVAVVTYEANETIYRHFVNLNLGCFSGDIPLDHEKVRNETATAFKEHHRIHSRRETIILALTVYLVACVIIQTIWFYDANGSGGFFAQQGSIIPKLNGDENSDSLYYGHSWLASFAFSWVGFLSFAIIGRILYAASFNPLGAHIALRRAHFFRMLLNAPARLTGKIPLPDDSTRSQLTQAATDNHLDDTNDPALLALAVEAARASIHDIPISRRKPRVSPTVIAGLVTCGAILLLLDAREHNDSLSRYSQAAARAVNASDSGSRSTKTVAKAPEKTNSPPSVGTAKAPIAPALHGTADKRPADKNMSPNVTSVLPTPNTQESAKTTVVTSGRTDHISIPLTPSNKSVEERPEQMVNAPQPVQAQNEPADTQLIRTELGKAVTDLRAALAQLARIETEAATLPKTFTAGGQTHNRWNQLNSDKERWTTEQNKALERYDQLVVRSGPLPPGNAAIADLLTICTQLLARNEVVLKTAQAKLSGVEGELRRGPASFVRGSQVDVRQTQLSKEKEYWTAENAKAEKDRYKLQAQYATLKEQSIPPKMADTTAPTEEFHKLTQEDKTITIISQVQQAIRAGQYEPAKELFGLLFESTGLRWNETEKSKLGEFCRYLRTFEPAFAEIRLAGNLSAMNKARNDYYKQQGNAEMRAQALKEETQYANRITKNAAAITSGLPTLKDLYFAAKQEQADPLK
jgi:DNA-directed RNA polymerase subunit RPC12/RpoP